MDFFDIRWIPLFPLLGFLVNGIWYGFFQTKPGVKKLHAPLPGMIASLAIFLSFVVSVIHFIKLQALPEHGEQARVFEVTLFSWISVGALHLPFTLRLDALSSLFTLVITGVGTLIHLYSIGYMSHDESPQKFFCYLNLFCVAMLILVTGGSLPILFLGWEGVGLCSYLLIGFWYQDIEKAKAGKKAFIANRVGDLGFLIGVFFMFSLFGTLDFQALNAKFLDSSLMGGIAPGVITITCLAFFLGCTGKSAQIPLYVWLPDAMAGPTPVSALIHAATMVTSGIYLLARLSPFYLQSPSAMLVIAVVGALTAFFAATIAVVQTDIKKVLAYSTVSQLGYMFLACGVGAFSTGVFHVITHAFFKALLFLGAGSVIHGMHEEQNILKMGGLKSKMPLTFFTFLLGWIAICGVPPFSGFFSKDEVLWNAFASPQGSKILWVLGVLTAIMTAFYMTRLFVLTFLGKPRFDVAHVHPHESPASMTLPLVVLGLLSAVGGVIGIPHHSWLEHWLEGVIPIYSAESFTASHSTEYALMGVSTLGALLGIGFAFASYRDPRIAEARKQKFRSLHEWLTHKWYIDELYQAMIIAPIYRGSLTLWKRVDGAIIDRAVLGLGGLSRSVGRAARTIQTGSLQAYVLLFFFGILLTVGYLIYGMV